MLQAEVSTEPIEVLGSIPSLADDLVAVEQVIRDRLKSRYAPRVEDIAAHIFDGGGKRLRPLLTLAAARMCGYEGTAHVGLAATVELIHTATLLHDDVIDESQRRRGRPTANLLWDNKSSVLVGDYLFSRAFQLMVETGSIRILDVLANASATIAEGEVLQLTASRSLATDEATYLKVIRGKTAALFSAATEVGGIIAGAPENVVEALSEFGLAFGICFQITDDILDYQSDTRGLHKNIGDDFRESKLTLPVIKAVSDGSPEEIEFWRRIIERGEPGDDDFDKALEILKRRNSLARARADAENWSDKATVALSSLPDSSGFGIRDLLIDLAKSSVSRLN